MGLLCRMFLFLDRQLERANRRLQAELQQLRVDAKKRFGQETKMGGVITKLEAEVDELRKHAELKEHAAQLETSLLV